MKLVTSITGLTAAIALSTSVIAMAADDHKGHDHDGKKAAEHPHDAKPMYGGVVTVVKDVNYELVTKNGANMLYVTDHGKPVPTTDASAALTLLSATDKAEAKLLPAGENKLEAKGDFKAQPGTKAAGSVKFGNKPAQNIRFTLE